MDSDTLFPYCISAIKMLEDLKRQGSLHNNPFDEEGKRKVVEEIRDLYETVEIELENVNKGIGDPKFLDKPYIIVNHYSAYKNKQCMMAYLMERIRLIKEIRWKSCSEYIPEDIASCLHPSEKKFACKYNENLRKYMSSVGVDLTLNMDYPPNDLYIDAIVLKDQTTIMTDDGSIPLKKNELLHIKRSYAEPLIKSGKLKQINL